MEHNIYIYILLAGAVSYLLRVIPVTVFRKPITNRFVRSFLYYVPYVTLAVMTFPAILTATGSVIPGLLALLVGMVLAWISGSLPLVAMACCVVALLAELAMRML
ncbi:MAG: AzlD domain-containing protein [Lachnospiraceae bacterium]|nr:AzlD domain-containing protein [Lachnospiraceae bacterium]